MKGFIYSMATACLAASLLSLTSCSDNNTSNATETSNDTMLTESRRNTTDTINYLTNDTSKKAQDLIDPNPPGTAH